jgi:hypothetical protein
MDKASQRARDLQIQSFWPTHCHQKYTDATGEIILFYCVRHLEFGQLANNIIFYLTLNAVITQLIAYADEKDIVNNKNNNNKYEHRTFAERLSVRIPMDTFNQKVVFEFCFTNSCIGINRRAKIRIFLFFL